MFSFTIQSKHRDSKARVGKLQTPHGVIETPTFIPVGTQASVKGLASQDITEIGAQIVLANTYHLHLRPGENTVKKMGGLSEFMSWGGPTMTDSGGFQVFSLGVAQEKMRDEKGQKLNKFSKSVFLPQQEDAIETIVQDTSFIKQSKEKIVRQRAGQNTKIKPAKIDDRGATFYSHLDGSEHRLDPKSSILMQEKIGADLIVAFDDHESPLWDYTETKASLDRTNRWALQSLAAHKRKDQLMYGVVHGGIFQDLRESSAQFTDKHFKAIAIGGAYTSKELLYKAIDWTIPFTQEDKPRHLLGIGEPMDILEAVERGLDFFDCVAPTRRARHGNMYIRPTKANKRWTYQVINEEYKLDKKPLDPTCACYTCQHFTRAYINHLFRAHELSAYRLASYHNVYFITKLMEDIRGAIKDGSFAALKKSLLF